jgi:hypothetical protein
MISENDAGRDSSLGPHATTYATVTQYEQMRMNAYESHKKSLVGHAIVTCDMCECGMHTGTAKTELCRNLRQALEALSHA